MKDLKHLLYFENLLQEAHNDLIAQAQNEGKICVAYACENTPEPLLNLPGAFSTRLRAPRTGSMEMATYYMTSFLSRSRSNSVRSPALCRNISRTAGTGTPRKSRSFRARSSCMRSFRPSPGAMTARALTRPYNTARPAPTAAAATRGCSRVTRSISSKLRRADNSTPPCLWAAKETEAVAQPLLIEKQTKRE